MVGLLRVVPSLLVCILSICSLSGWLCWDEGWRMWLLMRYMLLRLSNNMYVFCDRYCGRLGLIYSNLMVISSVSILEYAT